METYGLTLSAPRSVNTRFGEKTLRKATPTEAFWSAWREDKAAVKNAGWSLGKDRRTNQWEVCHWGSVSDEVVAERKEAVEASRAVEAIDPNIHIPAPEGLNYLPYQRAGIAYAAGRTSTLIGDEMGLGKTIQAIGVSNLTAAKSALVIVPASLKINWRNEWEKWDTNGHTVGIASTKVGVPETDVVIVNYEILKKLHDGLRSREWELLIVDEAHRLKTPTAQRTKEVFGFTPTDAAKKKARLAGKAEPQAVTPIKATRRLHLTGTPIVNRPVELFPLVNSLDPVAWPSFFPYALRYCAAVKNRWGWDFTGSSNLDELQRKLRETVMIRRLKKDVLTELPPKVRQIVTLPQNGLVSVIEAERAIIDEIEARLDELRAAVELSKASDDPRDYANAAAELAAAERVAFERISKVRHDTAVAKAPEVIKHVEEAVEQGGKIIVFAHHHDVIDQFVEAFGSTAVTVDGRVAPDARQALVERFQTDDSVRVFIGGIQAAGVGLTLTASSAVIFAELDFVPGNVTQAEDRAHRIGQRDSVLVQHVVLDGSYDCRMVDLIVAKQAVIDAALDDDHAERVYDDVPVFVNPPVSTEPKERDRLAEEAEGITVEQKAAIHAALKAVAGDDEDWATEKNGVGFNKIDGRVGHSLAWAPSLSPRQAALGRRLVRKYHRQIDPVVYEVVFPAS